MQYVITSASLNFSSACRLLSRFCGSESLYTWSRCDTKTVPQATIDNILHYGPQNTDKEFVSGGRKLPKWAVGAWSVMNPKVSAKLIGQPFHSVSPSPLPMFVGLGFFFTAGTLIHSIRAEYAVFTFHWFWPVAVLALIMAWLNEVFSEESQGFHTLEVQQGFRIGIVLFILSEAMLFLSFFWAFFHLGFNPSVTVGVVFPPVGVPVFDWYRIPLLNTIILLSSGLSLTIAHKLISTNDSGFRGWQWSRMLANISTLATINTIKQKPVMALNSEITSPQLHFINVPKGGNAAMARFSVVAQFFVSAVELVASGVMFRLGLGRYVAYNKAAGHTQWYTAVRPRFSTSRDRASIWIVDTVIRGFIFLGLQSLEYTQSLFTIRTSAYGGVFFGLTGLHGFHVFVGAVMLAISAFMMWPPMLSPTPTRDISRPFWWGHRVAFDGAAWYWHFVDVVWLFVFVIVYWWGGNFFQ